MDPELSELQDKKEELCMERIELAKLKKSDPWTKSDLENILKYLKKGKSRDPNRHVNEICHIDLTREDLKNAILVLMNKIKEQLNYPHDFEACNITSIYKKGKRNIFANYRFF